MKKKQPAEPKGPGFSVAKTAVLVLSILAALHRRDPSIIKDVRFELGGILDDRIISIADRLGYDASILQVLYDDILKDLSGFPDA